MGNNPKDKFLQTSVFRNGDIDSIPERDDDDGFIRLKPTKEGQARLNAVRERRRRHQRATAYLNYNTDEASKMLDLIIDHVQENRYGKGMDVRSRTILDSLIDAFLHIDQGSKNAANVNSAVKKMIKICKSYYEYDDKQRQFLDDGTYDQVVAYWRKLGFEEPTGYAPNKSRKTPIRHPRLHNNMDKAYRVYENDPLPIGVKESDSVEAWLTRCYKELGLTSESNLVIELSPKIDGISGNGDVTAKGRWINPQTRGDDNQSLAIIGLNNLELVDSKVIKHPFAIQFEIFCTENDRIGSSMYLEREQPYVGCRQAASGIVNRLCTGDDNGLLPFVNLYPIEADGLDEIPYLERMKYLSQFAIVPKDMIKRTTVKGNMTRILYEIRHIFKKWEDDRENHEFTYDGIVLTVADDEYQKVLGRQGRTNLYQIALKFDPASALATVAGIHLDFGKKGFRTVQVDLEHAVFLDGVRYDHVPVLSAKLFDKIGLRMGDLVRINRTGDVIPSITVEKASKNKPIKAPDVCPDCGHRLQIKNSKFYCGNPQCASNLSGRIEFYLKALEIDRYGESFADMLVETFDNRILDEDGHTVKVLPGVSVTGISDLYHLTPDVFTERGITTKDALKFHDRLMAATEKMADYEIIGALGIPDVGRARAYDLLKAFGGLKGFIRELYHGDSIQHTLCEALGNAIGGKVYEALALSDGADRLCQDISEISQYVSRYTRFDANTIKIGHTGIKKLPEDILDSFEDLGFMLVDGKNFDILITADKNSTSGKMAVARKKNLPVYTVNEFAREYVGG